MKTSSKWDIGISAKFGACGVATLLRCCGNVGIIRGSQAETTKNIKHQIVFMFSFHLRSGASVKYLLLKHSSAVALLMGL